MTTTTHTVERIGELNDRARHGLDRTAKRVVTRTCLMTIAGSESDVALFVAQARIIQALRQWEPPVGDRSERDLGYFELDGHRLMFKCDYYAPGLEWGSENPADPDRTIRVITVMLPSDY
ncbi:DUF3768 domain-containing protein (plasmid) [Sphingobium fuliginis]|jgi:hypothetical protein|uniref:DUF3768 domain-containing protein n=1 Tax=Sphingobium fuliginis (strain ATCC 27551) TaxID=336203 RepID=A0A7M2GP64_SPHSA|nr:MULTISPECIES: DUF3768 domain-containing protein [Sphingobium]QOT74534.1 DUF3768 domain-containing protein [Sphingobium fuliginis]